MRDARLRHERLIHAIREILSELLLKEVKDPRLHGVVISAVELSGDTTLARAFFSIYGDEERERQALDGLRQAHGYLRREMARRMRMHSPPDLEFRRDLGYERADRVQRILDQLDIPPAEDEATSDESGVRDPGSGVRDEDDENG
jgi:ribosome-binding factor A